MVACGTKWGDNDMFMGEYNHTIDDKGRIIIPSKLRTELGENFVVTRGLDNCLAIYTSDGWAKIIEQYKQLPNIGETRSFLRFIISGATTLEFDKQGRINIPSSLINFADLSKDCSIIGVGDHMEIWDTNHWNEYLTAKEANITEIADKLFSRTV